MATLAGPMSFPAGPAMQATTEQQADWMTEEVSTGVSLKIRPPCFSCTRHIACMYMYERIMQPVVQLPVNILLISCAVPRPILTCARSQARLVDGVCTRSLMACSKGLVPLASVLFSSSKGSLGYPAPHVKTEGLVQTLLVVLFVSQCDH